MCFFAGKIGHSGHLRAFDLAERLTRRFDNGGVDHYALLEDQSFRFQLPDDLSEELFDEPLLSQRLAELPESREARHYITVEILIIKDRAYKC